MSVEKTKMFFSKGVSHSVVRSLSYKSGFIVTQDLGKYLGVPLLHQRITKQTYGYIIESLHKKLATWKSKQLSFVGRITLCKSILATVPLYPICNPVYYPSQFALKLKKFAEDLFGGTTLRLNELILLTGKLFVN